MGRDIENEPLTLSLMGGGALITIAIVILQLKPATVQPHHPVE
jgi:hypothetical protein